MVLLFGLVWTAWLVLIVLIGWSCSAMLSSLVRFYCLLDPFGLLCVVFQWFILALGFAWTVLIVCILLILWIGFGKTSDSLVFILLPRLGWTACSVQNVRILFCC